jgi:hypothetical protein
MKSLLTLLAPLIALALWPAAAAAQTTKVVGTCGVQTYAAGTMQYPTQDQTGRACSGGGGSPPYTPTIVPLDVSTVTTGGTPVAALSAGHRTAGGWITNPENATVRLCYRDDGGTPTGTYTGAQSNLVCLAPAQGASLTPSPLALYVVTSDNAHPFAGEGYQ